MMQEKFTHLQELIQIKCGEDDARAVEKFFNNLGDFLEKNESGSVFKLIAEPKIKTGKDLQKPPAWQRQITSAIMIQLQPNKRPSEIYNTRLGREYRYQTADSNIVVIKDVLKQQTVWYLGITP